MHKETVRRIIADLNAGRPPQFPLDDFPCFSAEATEGTELLAKFAAGQLAWAERSFALKGLSISEYEELAPEALEKMQAIVDRYSHHLTEEDYETGFDD